MTLSDLIPVHFPEVYEATLELLGESFDNADRMDLILVYSEHTKQDVVRTLGIDADKIRVIHLATDERYRPIADRNWVRTRLARYGLGERPYIVHIGALEPRKNLCRLVEAFHSMKHQHPGLEHQLVL